VTTPSIRLLGVPIARLTRAALLDRFHAWIDAGVPRRVYPIRSGLLLEADLNLAAGEEIRVAARLTGQPVPERLAPDDWIDPLIALLASSGRGLCYLGGPPGAGQAWIDALRRRHSGLEAFARDGAFEKWGPENDRVVAAIVRARPAVVLVGFGSPYQEEYVHAHADLFQAPLSVAVGPLAEARSGMWPRGPLPAGPLGDGLLARIGGLLRGPVREAAAHVVDPAFLARVVKAHRG
jgi:N-acetylglucosaminyldiphosphoundecaprenol N-acetyl-beta-D-mannosaminyltransferase